MEIFENFKELFLSVWNKGIIGVDFVQILIGLGIFFIFFASNDDDDQDGGKLIKSFQKIN